MKNRSLILRILVDLDKMLTYPDNPFREADQFFVAGQNPQTSRKSTDNRRRLLPGDRRNTTYTELVKPIGKSRKAYSAILKFLIWLKFFILGPQI